MSVSNGDEALRLYSDGMTDADSAQSLDASDLLRFIYTCPLGLLLTDQRGEVRILNGSATALLIPYCPEGSIDNLFQFLAYWDEGAAVAMNALVTQPRAQSMVQRIRVFHDEDQSRWLEFCALKFDTGLSVTCRDVTDTVQHEEILHIARKEAEQRGRADMAAGIIHDMGNILTGLGSQAVAVHQLLGSENSLANLKRLIELLAYHLEGLDQILGAGKGRSVVNLLQAIYSSDSRRHSEFTRIIGVFNTYLGHAQELLAISRSYAAQGVVPVADQLKQLIFDLHGMTDASFRKRKGLLRITLPDKLPALSLDRSKIMQILLNLIKNAQEAWDTAPSEPLLVELCVTCNPSHMIAISIRDNGCGIEPEKSESLFRRNVSTKQRGSGFGLYTSRKLAESMGGRLTLHSNAPMRGAVATLYLPIDIGSDAPIR